jgi:hypothetical protein
VCRHLGLEPPVVNLWAKGKRPMPRRYLDAFEQFVWEAVGRTSARYQDAVEREGQMSYVRINTDLPLLAEDPGPDAPLVVQQWWAFHREAVQLMDAWTVEVSPEPLNQELGEVCREVARFGFMDEESRLGLLLSGTRPALAALRQFFARGGQLVETVERLPPRPLVQSWRRALLPR